MEDVLFSSGTPDEIDALAQQLNQAEAALDEFNAELAPIKESIASIDEIKEEAARKYRETVAAIIDRESELKAQRMQFNNDIANQRRRVDSARRQLHDAQRIERLAAKSADLDKRLDETMTLAKWFNAAFAHQFEAAKKITYYRKLILADAPGLGKTLTALAAADMVKEATANARPDNPYGYDPGNRVKGVTHQCGRKILYVCPAPLLRNVLREVHLWTDRSPVLMGNQSKLTRRFLIDTLNEMDDFLVIINYEAWRRDHSLLNDLKALQFDFVILDEAHMLKDRQTGAYKGIAELLSHRNPTRIHGMEEYENDRNKTSWNRPSDSFVPFVLPMTGTPILNKPQDLYSLLTLVDPDHFTSERYFLRDYCSYSYETKKWGFRAGGLDSLAKRISNLYMRRTKRDAGIILPGKHEEIHEIPLDKDSYPDQAKARTEMKKYGAILMGEKTISAAAEIAIYTRLRQIETWPAGIEVKNDEGIVILKLEVEESQKIDYVFKEGNGLLADLTEGGLEEGSVCVVFSQFKAPLRELHRRLSGAGIKAVVLDGDTPQSLRDEILLDFDRRHTSDAKAKWQVVLANYRVGGVGVTLTRATEMIMLDSEWSSGREDQATDRVHRIGQTEDVTIHKIMMERTIDTWLESIVESKRQMTSGFDDATTTVDDLRDDFRKMLEED